MKVVTTEEMRGIEEAMVSRGTPLDALMQRAGTAVARSAAGMAGGQPVLILAGPGNNGGDGLVAARWLLERGHPVAVYAFRRRDLMGYRGAVVAADDDTDAAGLAALLGMSRVIVDALLGIGQTRPTEGALATIIRTANASTTPVARLSVDIPTGINTDTGAVQGEAFRADTTLCMGFPKRGALLYPGAEYAGRVEVADIGMPPELARDVPVRISADASIAALLPQRPAESNKGTYGRLLVVGGSQTFLGAPGLATLAAYRIGAGLVELAVIPYVQQSIAAHLLEPIFRPLPEWEGRISEEALPSIEEGLQRASACVFGPGISLSDETTRLTREVLRLIARAGIRGAVIDADALNALSRLPDWWTVDVPAVLTPHPGEMSRLTGLSIKEVQSDRVSVASGHARKWGTVVVLKGAATVVASPTGEVAINTTGGPNLATAGSGDVLSGTIGGLLAQGCNPFDAAVAGVYLHGRAGDMLAERHGDAGTLAGDLPAALPEARLSILRQAKERS